MVEGKRRAKIERKRERGRGGTGERGEERGGEFIFCIKSTKSIK